MTATRITPGCFLAAKLIMAVNFRQIWRVKITVRPWTRFHGGICPSGDSGISPRLPSLVGILLSPLTYGLVALFHVFRCRNTLDFSKERFSTLFLTNLVTFTVKARRPIVRVFRSFAANESARHVALPFPLPFERKSPAKPW